MGNLKMQIVHTRLEEVSGCRNVLNICVQAVNVIDIEIRGARQPDNNDGKWVRGLQLSQCL